jgi:tRNA threonylcarbamoyladenosine biosynthesis protein TsaE
LLSDEAATREAGAALGRVVQGGDAIALVGDLGAGKTTFVSGLVAALGAGTHQFGSPTFSLVNEYAGGRLIVWHVDLYRIEKPRELVELGLEEMLGDRRGVCLVEWADKYDVMPADHLRVTLAHAGQARTVEYTGTGPRGQQLAKLLQPATP